MATIIETRGSRRALVENPYSVRAKDFQVGHHKIDQYYSGPDRINLPKILKDLTDLKSLGLENGLDREQIKHIQQGIIKSITSPEKNDVKAGLAGLSELYTKLTPQDIPTIKVSVGEPQPLFFENAAETVFSERAYLKGRVDPHRHQDSLYRTFND
ncbi:hypothetical protein BH11PAT1_BH11PAT1_1680 [soil metagenome]